MARSGGQKCCGHEPPGTESQDGRPGKFSRAPRESPAHRESASFTGRLVSETCMAPCMAPCMALVCSWIKSITPQMINQPRRSFSGVGGVLLSHSKARVARYRADRSFRAAQKTPGQRLARHRGGGDAPRQRGPPRATASRPDRHPDHTPTPKPSPTHPSSLLQPNHGSEQTKEPLWV